MNAAPPHARHRYGRAVVLGAGVAGMAAAAALRGSVDEVVVLERDDLPARPVPRRGVPQGHQLHNLLTRAQVHLEHLIPGALAALDEGGCTVGRVALDTYVFELGRRMPERDLGRELRCAPRPLVEHVMRRLLEGDDRITVRRGAATGLVASADGRVAAVGVEGPEGPSTIDADLVVDSTGAGSQAGAWLRAIGHDAVPVQETHPDQWYASTVVRRPAAWRGVNRFWLLFPTATDSRGVLVSPQGGDEWYVSVSGRRRDPVPEDLEGMRSHALELEDPVVGELLRDAEPTGPMRTFRKIVATWHRYDQLDAPLAGFFPVGDAIAALNPLLGQGMSTTLWEADLLGELIAAPHADLAALTRAYLEATRDIVTTAWELTAFDFRTLAGADVADASDAIAQAITDDPQLHRAYVDVWHLMAPVQSLLRGPFHDRVRSLATSGGSA